MLTELQTLQLMAAKRSLRDTQGMCFYLIASLALSFSYGWNCIFRYSGLMFGLWLSTVPHAMYCNFALQSYQGEHRLGRLHTPSSNDLALQLLCLRFFSTSLSVWKKVLEKYDVCFPWQNIQWSIVVFHVRVRSAEKSPACYLSKKLLRNWSKRVREVILALWLTQKRNY